MSAKPQLPERAGFVSRELSLLPVWATGVAMRPLGFSARRKADNKIDISYNNCQLIRQGSGAQGLLPLSCTSGALNGPQWASRLMIAGLGLNALD